MSKLSKPTGDRRGRHIPPTSPVQPETLSSTNALSLSFSSCRWGDQQAQTKHFYQTVVVYHAETGADPNIQRTFWLFSKFVSWSLFFYWTCSNGHVFYGAHNCTKTAPECVDRKAMFDRKAGLGPRMEVWQCPPPFFFRSLIAIEPTRSGRQRLVFLLLFKCWAPLPADQKPPHTRELLCVVSLLWPLMTTEARRPLTDSKGAKRLQMYKKKRSKKCR